MRDNKKKKKNTPTDNQFSPSTGTSLRHNGKKQEDLSFCCFSLGFNAANY